MKQVAAEVDLGVTTINTVLANPTGAMLIEDSLPTESHLGLDGVPGLVDILTGVVKFVPNLPNQWRDVVVATSTHPRRGK